MRVLFLTDNFPPEVNAPANRTYEHCKEWARAGHQITVITCAPNFPGGKVFSGYRNRLFQSDYIDGIKVIRVWTYISANEGVLRRTIDYVSFMVMAVIVSPFAGRADIVIATSPQFFTACAGYCVSLLKRRPFVFELRDLWPESIRAVGAIGNATALRALERLELFLYRRARAIVSVTHSFRENLSKRGIDAGKIIVVTNGVDRSRFRRREKDGALLKELGYEGKFVAAYVGTIGMAHGIEVIVEAAARMQEAAEGNDVRFLVLGDGAQRQELMAKARDRGLDRIAFLNSVDRDDVVRYWSIVDVAIVHLRDDPLFRTVIPSKIFEAMAMGVPVVAGIRGEAAELLKAHRSGLLFEPGSPDELCSALLKLKNNGDCRKDLSDCAHAAASQFDRRHLAMRMIEGIQQVIEIRHRTEHRRLYEE